MRKHSKKFLVFLLIIIAIVGIFYIYSAMKTAKAYSFFKPLDVLETFKNLPAVKAAAEYGKKTIDKVEEKIKNQADKEMEAFSENVSESADKLKNSAFNFVKKNINSGLDAMGGLLGVDIPQVTTTTNQKCNN